MIRRTIIVVLTLMADVKHKILFGVFVYASIITGGFCIGTFVVFGTEMDRTIYYQFYHERSKPLWSACFRPASLTILGPVPETTWMGPSHTHTIRVAPWWPFLVCVAYPLSTLLLGSLRRCRRRKKGLCDKCGYDLTGNESGTCPECGDEVPALREAVR